MQKLEPVFGKWEMYVILSFFKMLPQVKPYTESDSAQVYRIWPGN